MMLCVRRIEMKKRNPPVVAAALGAALFSAVWHGLFLSGRFPWSLGYSDVLHLYDAAVAPGWPYLDRAVEYPVLTGLFLKLAAALRPDVPGYYAATCAGLGALALAATFLLEDLAPDRGRLLLRWSLSPSLFFFLVYNWDMLAVFCAVAALACAARGRAAAAGACLALGFSAKLYPIVGLPALLIATRGTRARLAALAGFAAAAAAVNVPFMWASLPNWLYVFAFNGAHPPNADSLWSLARVALGIRSVGAINAASLAAFAVLLAFALWRLRRRPLVELTYGATLAFLLAGKMFSPQYALWLLPFFALLPAPRRWIAAFELSNLAVLFLALHAALAAHDSRLYWPVMAFAAARHASLAALLLDLTRSHGRTRAAA
jgi:hypothetical protein